MTGAIQVWLLSDGVPGHVNQARGLMYWMAKRRALKVDEVPLRLGWNTQPADIARLDRTIDGSFARA